MQIKERCWRYETIKGAYFVKFYEDELQARKVRQVHEQLADVHFPYSLPITSTATSPYLVQRWVEGRAANYNKKRDRTETLYMLEQLHRTTKGWTVPYMSVQNLTQKWQVRLQRFRQQESLLRPLLGPSFDRIVHQAKYALKEMETDSTVVTQRSVLHGDVVHHNFLLGGQPLLIDFDLAHLGDPAEEVILWMHRVLPHIGYDVDALLVEQPYTKHALAKIHYLRYPNELLREWLYVLQVGDEQRAHLLDYVQSFTKETLYNYPKMNEQINRLMS